jgi:hypothetical protein
MIISSLQVLCAGSQSGQVQQPNRLGPRNHNHTPTLLLAPRTMNDASLEARGGKCRNLHSPFLFRRARQAESSPILDRSPLAVPPPPFFVCVCVCVCVWCVCVCVRPAVSRAHSSSAVRRNSAVLKSCMIRSVCGARIHRCLFRGVLDPQFTLHRNLTLLSALHMVRPRTTGATLPRLAKEHPSLDHSDTPRSLQSEHPSSHK